MKIDGKKIAEKIISGLKQIPKPDKMLAAVLVGSNSQSLSFLRQKEKMAQALEIPFHLYQFDESISQDQLIVEIRKIGDDPEIGGIIVQLPLPKHYDRDIVLSSINPKKDIDAMTPRSKEFVSPLPVEVVKDVLGSVNYGLEGKAIAVIGRGFLVGKPIMDWLDSARKDYKLFYSKSDIAEVRYFDLKITGVGKGGLIKPEMLKGGVGVIDFGYDLVDGKIKGDFDAQLPITDYQLLNFYTPTPGGTGPILVAEIFKNFYKLNK